MTRGLRRVVELTDKDSVANSAPVDASCHRAAIRNCFAAALNSEAASILVEWPPSKSTGPSRDGIANPLDHHLGKLALRVTGGLP